MRMLNKIKTEIVKVYDVEFKNPAEFCRTMLDDRDYFFSIGGCGIKPNPKIDDDESIDYMKQYDPDLLQVYQRKDNNLVVKNIKMMAGNNPKDKGFIKFIDQLNYINDKIAKNKVAQMIIAAIAKGYDDLVRDKYGNCPATYIWIPVWNSTARDAKMIVVAERLVFVIS